MPKFDVVIGNPPFKGTLHLKFLELAYNISERYIIWVHPSGWMLDEKHLVKKNKEIKDMINGSVKELTFFNGNPIFNVGLFSPFVIESIDKNEKNSNIEVIDRMNNKEITYENIYEVNKWSNTSVYPSLKDKILKLSKNDNLYNHKNKNEGEYFVNAALIRGNVDRQSINKQKSDDFYSLIPKNEKPSKDQTKRVYFTFKNLNEAENFISFIETRWAMFALSIYKSNQHQEGSETSSVPWLDWSKKWNEKAFEKLINATSEEIEFVKNHIPNYYNV